MRVLIDTHVLLWWLAGDDLSPQVADAISDAANDVFVSAATIWELSIKQTLGKVDMPDDLVDQLRRDSFTVLPIDERHAMVAGRLPRHHDDPFDRMLIAQALVDTLVLATRDRELRAYDVPVLEA